MIRPSQLLARLLGHPPSPDPIELDEHELEQVGTHSRDPDVAVGYCATIAWVVLLALIFAGVIQL